MTNSRRTKRQLSTVSSGIQLIVLGRLPRSGDQGYQSHMTTKNQTELRRRKNSNNKTIIYRELQERHPTNRI